MNKAGLFAGVVFSLALMVLFTGCDEEGASQILDSQKLETPSFSVISQEGLGWNGIDGAAGYLVDINGLTFHTTEPSYPSMHFGNGAGQVIRVKAQGRNMFYDSDWSDEIVVDRISPPDSVAIASNGALTWIPDAKAKGYNVSIYDENLNWIKAIDINIVIDRASLVSVQTEDLPLGKYIFEILPFATPDAHANLSEAMITEYNKSMFEKSFHSSSNSESNLHLNVNFKLREDLAIGNYSFISVAPAEQLAEYNKAYSDLLDGTRKEKDAATKVIGNDIVLYHYYFKNGEKIVVATKNKAWDGYLNRYNDLVGSPPADLEKLSGVNIGKTYSKDYHYRSNHNVASPRLLEADNGMFFVEMVIIKDNSIFTEILEYVIR